MYKKKHLAEHGFIRTLKKFDWSTKENFEKFYILKLMKKYQKHRFYWVNIRTESIKNMGNIKRGRI